MNTVQKLLLAAVSLALVLILLYAFGNQQKHAAGGASPGIAAAIATTSPAVVNTTASTIFATSTCSARVISTSASPIMLTFSDVQGSVPTGSFGLLQPASTTVVYDSSQTGCGAFKAYSFTTGTITVSESR